MADSNIKRRSHNFIDLSGKTFGRLSVISFYGRSKRSHAMWLCVCLCGKEVVLRGSSITTGNGRSCGCLRVETHTTHGQAGPSRKTPEYKTWDKAKQRCTNPLHESYPYYGGRGIEFRFNSFEEFFSELGPKPTPQHSIDRIDVNGHYEIGNVRWATRKEQDANTRKNRR